MFWGRSSTSSTPLAIRATGCAIRGRELGVKNTKCLVRFAGILNSCPSEQTQLGCVCSCAGPGQVSSGGTELNTAWFHHLAQPSWLQSSCLASSAARVCSASEAPSFTPPSGRSSSGTWGPGLCATCPPRAAEQGSPTHRLSVPRLQQQPVWAFFGCWNFPLCVG